MENLTPSTLTSTPASIPTLTSTSVTIVNTPTINPSTPNALHLDIENLAPSTSILTSTATTTTTITASTTNPNTPNSIPTPTSTSVTTINTPTINPSTPNALHLDIENLTPSTSTSIPTSIATTTITTTTITAPTTNPNTLNNPNTPNIPNVSNIHNAFNNFNPKNHLFAFPTFFYEGEQNAYFPYDQQPNIQNDTVTLEQGYSNTPNNIIPVTPDESEKFERKNHLFSFLRFVVSSVASYLCDDDDQIDEVTEELQISINMIKRLFEVVYERRSPQLISYLDELLDVLEVNNPDKSVKGIADALAKDIHFGWLVCSWIKELLSDYWICQQIFFYWVQGSRIKKKDELLVNKHKLIPQIEEVEIYLELCKTAQKVMFDQNNCYSEDFEVFGELLKNRPKNSRLPSLFNEKDKFFEEFVRERRSDPLKTEAVIEEINEFKRSLKRVKHY